MNYVFKYVMMRFSTFLGSACDLFTRTAASCGLLVIRSFFPPALVSILQQACPCNKIDR